MLCTLIWKYGPLLPSSISLFLSFRKSQTPALACLKEHCVLLLLFPETRKHQLLLLLFQTRTHHVQENHHPCTEHYNLHLHLASCSSSCSPTGPGSPSPQTSSSGGAEAGCARPASRSVPHLFSTSTQPNRIQPQLKLQQVEEPCSNCAALPLQSLQGRYGQISASVLSSQAPTEK